MHVSLEIAGDAFELYLAREQGVVKVEVDGEIVEARILEDTPDGYRIEVAGETYVVRLAADDEVVVNGEPLALAVADFRPGGAPGAHGGGAGGAANVKPPMPGKVVAVKVNEGDEVKKGDVLLILEAMKMQNEIPSPTSGTVKKVNVKPGSNVEAKDVLVEIG